MKAASGVLIVVSNMELSSFRNSEEKFLSYSVKLTFSRCMCCRGFQFEEEKQSLYNDEERLGCCRFHVDKLSSAHVYLRMHKGQTMEMISPELLEDCAQLVKANSIQGLWLALYLQRNTFILVSSAHVYLRMHKEKGVIFICSTSDNACYGAGAIFLLRFSLMDI